MISLFTSSLQCITIHCIRNDPYPSSSPASHQVFILIDNKQLMMICTNAHSTATQLGEMINGQPKFCCCYFISLLVNIFCLTSLTSTQITMGCIYKQFITIITQLPFKLNYSVPVFAFLVANVFTFSLSSMQMNIFLLMKLTGWNIKWQWQHHIICK